MDDPLWAELKARDDAENDGRPDGRDFLGGCPVCGLYDVVLNVGCDHYAVCRVHCMYWYWGSNLASNWQREGEDDWARNVAELKGYEDVTAYYDAAPLPARPDNTYPLADDWDDERPF